MTLVVATSLWRSTALTALLCTPVYSQETLNYGVDVSWPMQKAAVTENYPWLEHNIAEDAPIPDEHVGRPIQHLGDRQTEYNRYIEGCLKFYGDKGNACLRSEADRVHMSLRQPASMKNYTDIGFRKIRAPDDLMDMLYSFWETNKDNESNEKWFTGNSYTNHWESPTTMVSVEDKTLAGGGFELKQRIWDAARGALEEWTGQELKESSLYGIRIYKEDAILATHVDRMPLISSCIINVAQDVDEDWPIEVIGHDGRAHNITMEPGDMVLYESHSVLHGRPFALKGRHYANVFIHFEPLGETRIEGRDEIEKKKKARDEIVAQTMREKGQDDLADELYGKGVGEIVADLPPYIVDGTAEADLWRRNHPKYNREEEKRKRLQVDQVHDDSSGATSAHSAAQMGSLERLKKHSDEFLSRVDINGWAPIHEASRAGHLDVVRHLVDQGVDFNLRTSKGSGLSPRRLAEDNHGIEHSLSQYFDEIGALSLGPDL